MPNVHRFRVALVAGLVLMPACGSSGSAKRDAQTAGVSGASGMANHEGGSGSTPSDGVSGSAPAGNGTSGGSDAGNGATGSGNGGTGNSVSGGAGSGTGGSGAGGSNTQHVVTPCPKSGSAVGIWENITPPGLPQNMQQGSNGAEAFAIDPKNTSTLYLGSDDFGIFKTEDCGATWAHIDTGTNGAVIDKGAPWTIAVDQDAPNVIYANSGYGANGLWQSTDSGVNWHQALSPDVAQYVPYGGFMERIAVDPTDHQHVVASFHGNCTGTWAPDCLVESKDAGGTWALLHFSPGNQEGSGLTIIDSKTWFYSTLFGGVWRTADGGATWKSVYSGAASDSVYRAKNGKFYSASLSGGILTSPDGVSWSAIPNSPSALYLTGDGTSLFTTRPTCDAPPAACQPYAQATEADPTKWTPLPAAPQMTRGGWVMHFDPDHNLLYSSNEYGGFWRLQTK